MLIDGLKLCTGCHSCYSICPKNAIKMVSNEEGFLIPSIDNERCISCGLCEKKCPILNERETSESKKKAYLMRIYDKEVLLDSSSGGVFYSLAENIIKNEGVVFGSRFTEDYRVIHDCCSSLEELAQFRKSKYVQSEIGESYKRCRDYLENNVFVLFCGTGCQIAGLKSYLGKNYKNLICVDLICHGVPSPFVWKEYLDFLKKKSEITYLSFRNKNLGWHDHSLIIKMENGKTIYDTHKKGPYLVFFLKNLNLRKSCYECKFKTINRDADITLADFWGLEKVFPDIDDNKGYSLVLGNSEKGNELISKLNNCFCKEISYEFAIKYNSALVKSVEKPSARDSFYEELKMHGFKFVTKKYANLDLKNMIVYKLVMLKKLIKYQMNKGK